VLEEIYFFRARQRLWAKNFTLTGHRGAAALAPENTLPSFYKAIECGATAVEFDVYATRDGVAVIAHDDDLTRLTGASVRITQSSYAELMKLKVFGKARIPTLREVLALAKGRLSVDIEIKAPGVEGEVVDALRELEMVEDAIVTSFLPGVIARVKKLAPEVEVGLLLEEWDDEYFDLAEKAGATFLLPPLLPAHPQLRPHRGDQAERLPRGHLDCQRRGHREAAAEDGG
jgi:Glycerophosphoryl diester phosphodiesterase